MSHLRCISNIIVHFCKDKSFILSCVIFYLLSAYPCLKHIIISYHSSECNEHIITCAGVIGLATISFSILAFCYKPCDGKGYLPLLPAAALCALAISPACIHLWTPWMLATLYISGWLALSYAICRKWAILLWYLWLLPAILLTLAAARYQITIDAHLVAEIIGASPQDLALFLTYQNIFLFTGSLILVLIFTYVIFRFIKDCEPNVLFIVGSLNLLLALGVAHSTKIRLWDSTISFTPENRVIQFNEARKIAQALQSGIAHLAEQLPSSAMPPPVLPDDKTSQEAICILHVGESVRSDHLSLFGYKRKTTPNLDALDDERLIAYRDCISVAPSTVPSTLAILTNAKTDVRTQDIDNSLYATCGGIMDIFHALDFSCFAFVNAENTNRDWGALYEKLLTKIFASGAKKILPIPVINDAHSQIAQVINTLRTDQNKHIFCFINNWGSHMPYGNYNHQSPPFSPASEDAYSQHPDKNKEKADIVINTYDCSIHYLDDYINKLLAQLKGKPFIYLYISDHGEYFGDKGLWVRNGDKEAFFNTPVCQVPFLIITSPEFEQQNPHYVQALQKLREHRDMSIGQEHIFHTLLGIFGIQSPYYEEELDLTSDKVQPYTGPHPSRGGKASDGKKWY